MSDVIKEFITVMERNKDNCKELECPACRLFCNEWIDVGESVYLLLNDKTVDDADIIMINRYWDLVGNILKDKKAVVINE